MRVFAVMGNNSAVSELELPTPQPSGTEVLLKVIRCGVCHTDTHLRDGGYDLGSRGMMRLVDRGITYPLVMGHEVVGVVTEVGPDVVGLNVGDVRLVYPWIGCGKCHQCAAGRDNYCAAGKNLGVARHGGYADHILVPDSKYLVDITGLDLSWAATMACSGLTAYSAVNKVLPLPSDEPVVVIGAGGVGLTAVATLKALDHQRICVVDVSPRNLDIAKELGATDVVTPAQNAGRQIIETCGAPVAAIIDFVNNDATASAAFDALRKGGQLVQVGLFGGEFIVPTALMTLKMLTITGSFVGTLDELHAVTALAKQGALPPIPIIEEPLDSSSVNSALDKLVSGGVAGRIVLRA
ncbi:alcohol dehydrogenase [Mycolicibacterium goodii]|uniref:Alcohol dehydrogenase n=1 Tax=Mycolicibacterium goodii TaxID=134601 RepID=A0ABS6I144_MYCGD|nr:alcohol dehydrogenase [Mycolicibacterium goodii]MBU8827480.1 alcohol dehydrogenase [Mycolicibacterium goodii]MBU8841615.1 alcohol dehydrogenase [Mycolicibacterium goodii]